MNRVIYWTTNEKTPSINLEVKTWQDDAWNIVGIACTEFKKDKDGNMVCIAAIVLVSTE